MTARVRCQKSIKKRHFLRALSKKSGIYGAAGLLAAFHADVAPLQACHVPDVGTREQNCLQLYDLRSTSKQLTSETTTTHEDPKLRGEKSGGRAVSLSPNGDALDAPSDAPSLADQRL